MIRVITDALIHPAEIGCVALGALAATAILLGARRGWVPWLAVLAILALGARAALYREGRAAEGLGSLPWEEWAGWVALYHSWAARVGWVAATVGSGLLTVEAWTSEAGPSRGRAVLAAAAAIFALSALGAPQLGWVALGIGALSAAPGGSDRPRTAFAAALGAAAAIAGAEAHLYQAAALVDPADVDRIDPAALARIGAWFGAAAATAWSLWRVGPTGGLLPIAGLVGLVGLGAGAARRGLERGPTDATVGVRDRLVEARPGPVARIPGGCLVTRTPDGWRGQDLGAPRAPGDLLERRGLPGCPASADRGAFGPSGVPIFALPGSSPTEDLLGWHGAPVGRIAVLVDLDPGWALPEWRISAVEFEVWEAPAITPAGELAPLDPRGIPLPGSVLVQVPGTPDRQLAELRRNESRSPRMDLLIHPDAAPTVGELLGLCRAARRGHPSGLRCVIAAGDPGRWERVLDRAPAGIEPDASFEVLEMDEIPFD